MLEWMQKHKKELLPYRYVALVFFASIVSGVVVASPQYQATACAKVRDIYISRQEYQRKYNKMYDNVAEYIVMA